MWFTNIYSKLENVKMFKLNIQYKLQRNCFDLMLSNDFVAMKLHDANSAEGLFGLN